MVGTSENFNGGWGGTYGPALPLELFDAMPWALRALYCYAAYDYTPVSAWQLFAAGKPVDHIVRVIRRRLRANMQRETLRLYGPDHPQAPR